MEHNFLEFNEFNLAVWCTVMFVLKLFAMMFMGLDDEDFDSEGIYSVFSINKVFIFFMGYGYAFKEWKLIPISLVVGILMVVIYHYAMKSVKHQSAPIGDQPLPVKEGDRVKAYTNINDTYGSIMFKGKRIDARTENKYDKVISGDYCKITKINDDNTVMVSES